MKLFKSLLKLVLVVILLCGVGVGIVAYKLSDNSFNEPDYLNNVEPTKLNINNLVSNSLEDTKDTSKMDITLEEKEINIILKSLSIDLNKQFANSGVKVETMYIDAVSGDDIKFISYIDIKGFKTSLNGEFLLGLNNNKFNITIDNIKVGKLGFEKDLITKLIQKFAGTYNLTKDIELAPGLFVKADLSSLSIELDLLDVKDVLLESLKTTNEYDLYQTIINVVFRVDELITLNKDSHEIGFNINLSSFGYDENTDAITPYTIDFDSVNTKVETLLNNGSLSQENASTLATYLVKGYEYSSEEVKETINDIDLSSVGITNNTTYLGLINYSPKEIKDTFIEQAATFNVLNPTAFEGFKIDENVWNDYFKTTSSIGKVFEFVRQEDGKYEATYLAINSLYIDIKDDHFALYLLASINGKHVVVNFELDVASSSGLTINSTVTSLRLGNVVLENEEISKLLTFLKNSMTDEWININPENKAITFNFTSMFSSNEILQMILNSELFGLETSFVENESNAYTLISLSF